MSWVNWTGQDDVESRRYFDERRGSCQAGVPPKLLLRCLSSQILHLLAHRHSLVMVAAALDDIELQIMAHVCVDKTKTTTQISILRLESRILLLLRHISKKTKGKDADEMLLSTNLHEYSLIKWAKSSKCFNYILKIISMRD